MNLASVLWTSTILLAITAAGGLVMAGISFKGNQHPPTWLAMLHGLLAAAAVTRCYMQPQRSACQEWRSLHSSCFSWLLPAVLY